MTNIPNSDVHQLAELVRDQLIHDDMYKQERLSQYDFKFQVWLDERIRNALMALTGWVDENLVVPLRNLLIRKNDQ